MAFLMETIHSVLGPTIDFINKLAMNVGGVYSDGFFIIFAIILAYSVKKQMDGEYLTWIIASVGIYLAFKGLGLGP